MCIRDRACALGFYDIFTLLHGLLLLRALFRILVQLLQENDQHPKCHTNTAVSYTHLVTDKDKDLPFV